MANMGKFYQGPVLPASLEGGAPVSATTIDSANVVNQLGERLIYKGEEYVFVHNAGATDASVGMAMVMTALSGYSLTISSLSASDFPMCVVKHATIVAGGFGWGIVRGITSLRSESTMPTGAWATLGDDGISKTYVISANTDTVKGAAFAKILSSGTGSGASLPLAYVRCFG